MNDREKLIKLVEDARYKDSENCKRHLVCKDCAYGDRASCHAAFIADHLIDNGVTVQQWIPVTERLPEPFVTVLGHLPMETPLPTVLPGFITKEGVWHIAMFDREPDEVTHWMPLPKPPKGE